jgi:hypothetical protein
MQSGEWARAGVYAFGSLLLGLASMALGLSAATALTRIGG